jgi:site-specific DNA recombinase
MLAILTRISRDNDDKVSIETQLESGIKLATNLGISYKQYEERVVSSIAPLDKRPMLMQMVKDIEDGIVSAVFVYDQTRLERSVETRTFLLKKFEKYKVKTYYNTGFVDSTSEDKLIGTIFSAFGEYTIELTSAKIKLALDYNTRNGKVHALSPYGYYKDNNKQYAINEVQAEVIREIYAMSLNGIGTNKIAEILNQRNIPTKYNLIGKGTLNTTNRKHKLKPLVTKNKADIKWTGNSIRGILYNKFYCGIRTFNGLEYEVPKLFEFEYWKKVNDNLQNNRNNSGKVVTHKYLLKGVLTCSKCKRNYYGRSRVSLKDNAYICSSKRYKNLNCGNRGINIPVLDALIWFYIENNEIEHIINYIQENSTDNIINEKELLKKSLNNELKEVKKQFNNLISLVENGIITAIEIKGKIDANKEKEKDLKIQIENISNEIEILNNSVSNNIIIPKEIDFNSKKDIINQLINNIEILFNDGFYYIRIYPVFNKIRFDLAYIEYVFDMNYKYKVTNVSYNNDLFKSVRFYNNKLSNLKTIKNLVL